MRWTLGAVVVVLLAVLALSGCSPTATPGPAGTAPAEGETPGAGVTPEATSAIPPTLEVTGTVVVAPTAAVTVTEQVTGTAEVSPTEALTATEEVTATAEVTGTEAVGTPATGEAPTVDGTIADGEYANNVTIGDSQLWWFNDGEMLTMAVEAPAEGWVGVGLDPDTGMQGADFKLAYLTGGEGTVTDAFGTQPTGPNHPSDDELGGTQDIDQSAVVSENGTTRFEFRVPLDSGDQYDKPLQPGGTYPVIVAHAPASEYNAYHSFRLAGEITLDAAP